MLLFFMKTIISANDTFYLTFHFLRHISSVLHLLFYRNSRTSTKKSVFFRSSTSNKTKPNQKAKK